jgi:hypothetical protein
MLDARLARTMRSRNMREFAAQAEGTGRLIKALPNPAETQS